MRAALTGLLENLDDPELTELGVIGWGAPVPSFGDINSSKVATLGLNPSNREFVDTAGNELDGVERRFHTLNSLGLRRWNEVRAKQRDMIEESCRSYFATNPYDTWFRELDKLIAGTCTSYYTPLSPACHLDLIPYATSDKWASLPASRKQSLLNFSKNSLGLLLSESPVELLILNGQTVVNCLEEFADTKFISKTMREWELPRKRTQGVMGYAYSGEVEYVGGVHLQRTIKVLGFNHNIQSSFGVTTTVKAAIADWIRTESQRLAW